jgi:hypothetical protein
MTNEHPKNSHNHERRGGALEVGIRLVGRGGEVDQLLGGEADARPSRKSLPISLGASVSFSVPPWESSSPFRGSGANANSLPHSPWTNIARTRMNSGVEQKQGRLDLFGPSYLQHIRRQIATASTSAIMSRKRIDHRGREHC